MKRAFSYGFITGLRVLEVIVVIGVILLFLASTDNSLKLVVDTVIKDRNITYSSLSGSLLQSIKIVQPKYNNHLIADSAEISWNLKTLLKNRVSIDKIILNDLNISTVEELLNSQKNSKKKSSDFDMAIDIDTIKISTLAYQNKLIDLSMFKLEAKDIIFKDKKLSISKFDLDTKTKLAKLQSRGSYMDKKLNIEDLKLKSIDLGGVIELISKLKPNKSSKPIALPLKNISIKQAELSTLPYKAIQKVQLRLKQLDSTLESNLSNSTVNAKNLTLLTISDLAKVDLNGQIRHNNLIAKSRVVLHDSNLSKNIKFINFKGLNPINLSLNANLESVDSNITLKSLSLFQGRFKKYKVSINSFFSNLHYDLKSAVLRAKSDANLTSPYSKELLIKNDLRYDKKDGLHYKGKLFSKEFRKFPKKYLSLFKDAKAIYFGDEMKLFADLNTSAFNLLYNMKNFKSAKFLLHSKELNISKIFDLPNDLKDLKASVDGKMGLDFKSPKVIIDTKIQSNAINAKGKIDFEHGFRLRAKTALPNNTILSNIDKNLKLNAIFPSDLNLTIKSEKLQINNSNKNLSTKLFYDLNSSRMDLQTELLGNKFQVSGDKKRLEFNTKIFSLKEAQKRFATIYDFKPIPLDGEIEVNSTISDYTNITAHLKSRWLVYEYTKNKFAFAEKININLHKNADDLTIDDYNLHAFIADDDRYLFAKNPSHIKLGKKKLDIQSLWINDELKNSGYYDFSSSKGEIKSNSESFHYKGKEGNFRLKINLNTLLSTNQTSIKGSITALDAVLTYKYKNSYEVDDPDIIIINDKNSKKPIVASKNNLILDITLNSIKKLKYKTDNIDITFLPDLKLWKEKKKSVELLGRVAILKGKYIEQNKEFIILPSELLFGGEFSNPYLTIKAKHYSDPYEIMIDISGKLDSPIINFSSTPFLSQSDILSLLLFDSTSDTLLSSNGSSSNMAISFFGSTFAKEIVKNFGIKLDKLMITTNEEGNLGFEIGKKVSKKVTIIYINDIVQTIKVKYQHSDHFETDLTLSPESSGIDFIFKKEH